jgi:hypothetical protein
MPFLPGRCSVNSNCRLRLASLLFLPAHPIVHILRQRLLPLNPTLPDDSRGMIHEVAKNVLTSDTADGFLSRDIGDMDKGVVEGSEDVGNTKDQLSFLDVRSEGDDLFVLGGSGFLGFWRLWISHRVRDQFV